MLSLNPLTMHRLNAKYPRAAESWRRLKSNVSRPISAILMLNTIANTGGATVGASAFANLYGQRNIWIYSISFTVVVLLGTEILPKIIGVTFRDRLAPIAGPVIEAISTLLRPAVTLTEIIFKPLKRKATSEQITTADLITLASLARSGKAINLEQENIIINSLRLSHTTVTHGMIKPEDIVFVSLLDSPESLLQTVRYGDHTRYPVSKTKDVKDIFAYIVTKKTAPATLDDITQLVKQAKPLHTVRQDDTLMTGLHTVLKHREHLLSVVNNKNQCVGIVTLEDIAGELLSADIEDFR